MSKDKTSVSSKVFERLVSVRHGRFMERSGVLPTTQFAYRKVWVPVMHFCACPIRCRVHWRVGRRLGSCRLTSVRAAFDRVNHLGFLYKLCSVGILGSVLSILIQFLSNRSQQVMVDGCRSKLVNVVSGVPQQCFGPIVVPPIHFGAFFHFGK